MNTGQFSKSHHSVPSQRFATYIESQRRRCVNASISLFVWRILDLAKAP
jgi:hypothetical protein